MLRIKITPFSELKNSDYCVKIQNSLNSLNGNPNFLNPSPSLESIQTEVDELIVLETQSQTGTKSIIGQKRLQREVVNGLLLQLMAFCAYAVRNTPYETAVQQIEAIGMEVAKSPSLPQPLEKVQEVSATWTGASGQIEVSWKSNSNGGRVHSYLLQIATTDPGNPLCVWQDAGISTRRKKVISGLSPLTNVWVRVIACGADNNVSVPSDPAISIVG